MTAWDPRIPIILLHVERNEERRIEAYVLPDAEQDIQRLRVYLSVHPLRNIRVSVNGPIRAFHLTRYPVVVKICSYCGARLLSRFCGLCGADLRDQLPTILDGVDEEPKFASRVPDPPRVLVAYLSDTEVWTSCVRVALFWFEQAVQEAKLERVLEDATEEEEFYFHVQPPVDVESLPQELLWKRRCPVHGLQPGPTCHCGRDLRDQIPTLRDASRRDSILPRLRRQSHPPIETLLTEDLLRRERG
ncbi:hypothetical protein GF380_02270 [Candidatus Uhrbacteria bacterium]|nr:hypothetical protein [Candidatus Uhrbacteria bacterium]MBD3284042.1 hypothetical protein [Candidatus Uhrbacteria bacterium]